MKFSKKSAISAVIWAIAVTSPIAAQASFTGVDASLTFSNLAFENDPVIFSNPQTVGPGVEFVSTGTDVFGQIWTFSVDISDKNIQFNFDESTRAGEPNGGNIFGPSGGFAFDLTFALPTVPPLFLKSYQSSGFFSDGVSALTEISHPAPNSVHFGFDRLFATDEYIISVIPEPEIYAMLLAGLGLIGFALHRRKA